MSGAVERALDDRIRVERGVFGLMDQDTAGCPSPWPQGAPPEGEEVWAQTNRVDFASAAPEHYVTVRLEAWIEEPPEGEAEVELELTSGVVELWSLTGGPSGGSLRVGPPGTYDLRVDCRRDDDRLMRYFQAPTSSAEGIEEYVLRFWPKQ
ncbi:hypothetical protein [Streptomyces violascens]|uniref:hypothetical protein n=1 Tax=Streptomyces violascens TaxID=67381 RepID=UPI00367C4BC0